MKFSGSYGIVYRINYNGFDSVIKFPKRKDLFDNITHEIKIYKKLCKSHDYSSYFPSVYYTGVFNESLMVSIDSEYVLNNFIGAPCLILEYINGVTLDNVRVHRKNARKIYNGISNILDFLKSSRIVYNDMKPDNFILQNNQCIRCVDLGLARTISKRFSDTSKFIGTPRFSSIHSHTSNTLDYSDDKESLIYMISYLVNGNLPWCNKCSLKDIYVSKLISKVPEICCGIKWLSEELIKVKDSHE